MSTATYQPHELQNGIQDVLTIPYEKNKKLFSAYRDFIGSLIDDTLDMSKMGGFFNFMQQLTQAASVEDTVKQVVKDHLNIDPRLVKLVQKQIEENREVNKNSVEEHIRFDIFEALKELIQSKIGRQVPGPVKFDNCVIALSDRHTQTTKEEYPNTPEGSHPIMDFLTENIDDFTSGLNAPIIAFEEDAAIVDRYVRDAKGELEADNSIIREYANEEREVVQHWREIFSETSLEPIKKIFEDADVSTNELDNLFDELLRFDTPSHLKNFSYIKREKDLDHYEQGGEKINDHRVSNMASDLIEKTVSDDKSKQIDKKRVLTGVDVSHSKKIEYVMIVMLRASLAAIINQTNPDYSESEKLRRQKEIDELPSIKYFLGQREKLSEDKQSDLLVELHKTFKKLTAAREDYAETRNKVMAENIQKLAEKYPNKNILVMLGRNHITEPSKNSKSAIDLLQAKSKVPVCKILTETPWMHKDDVQARMTGFVKPRSYAQFLRTDADPKIYNKVWDDRHPNPIKLGEGFDAILANPYYNILDVKPAA